MRQLRMAHGPLSAGWVSRPTANSGGAQENVHTEPHVSYVGSQANKLSNTFSSLILANRPSSWPGRVNCWTPEFLPKCRSLGNVPSGLEASLLRFPLPSVPCVVKSLVHTPVEALQFRFPFYSFPCKLLPSGQELLALTAQSAVRRLELGESCTGPAVGVSLRGQGILGPGYREPG